MENMTELPVAYVDRDVGGGGALSSSHKKNAHKKDRNLQVTWPGSDGCFYQFRVWSATGSWAVLYSVPAKKCQR